MSIKYIETERGGKRSLQGQLRNGEYNLTMKIITNLHLALHLSLHLALSTEHHCLLAINFQFCP